MELQNSLDIGERKEEDIQLSSSHSSWSQVVTPPDSGKGSGEGGEPQASQMQQLPSWQFSQNAFHQLGAQMLVGCEVEGSELPTTDELGISIMSQPINQELVLEGQTSAAGMAIQLSEGRTVRFNVLVAGGVGVGKSSLIKALVALLYGKDKAHLPTEALTPLDQFGLPQSRVVEYPDGHLVKKQVGKQRAIHRAPRCSVVTTGDS